MLKEVHKSKFTLGGRFKRAKYRLGVSDSSTNYEILKCIFLTNRCKFLTRFYLRLGFFKLRRFAKFPHANLAATVSAGRIRSFRGAQNSAQSLLNSLGDTP